MRKSDIKTLRSLIESSLPDLGVGIPPLAVALVICGDVLEDSPNKGIVEEQVVGQAIPLCTCAIE